jgi:transcriptional regulator with XRE-family HTH domain
MSISLMKSFPGPMSISPAQCRAARGLLRWSQAELQARSKVTKPTIANFELETRQPYERTLDAIQGAFEKAGIEFIPEGETSEDGGDGLRFKRRRGRGRPKAKAGRQETRA